MKHAFPTLEQMVSIENLAAAAQISRRGKTRRPEVEAWHLREESNILALREALRIFPGGGRAPAPARTICPGQSGTG